MISRREFLKLSGAGMLSLYAASHGKFLPRAFAQIPGGSLHPDDVPKYARPLVIPPAMPMQSKSKKFDYYTIAVRQFQQEILPPPLPKTTVWSYGAKKYPATFNYPAFTIEAAQNRPVRVQWLNELRNPATGNYLPHLLPVDPTLHWANPSQGSDPAYGSGPRDSRPTFSSTPGAYTGPVPIVTHVHGAVGVGDESDGYAEAWYLPAANNIPAGYATEGTWYTYFKGKAAQRFGVNWVPGTATFQYPNHNRASTIWYHDHALGMTRLNVYAGPAGFYIVRGGPSDVVLDSRDQAAAVLPGPAPTVGSNPFGTGFYEIPIAIQDRSFNSNGSLFYPDTRAFFDNGSVVPYIPNSNVSPIWNPEFFGNMMVVNGRTWPFLNVEQRRYRFRFLNGCDSRFLILDFSSITGVEVWQIGNEGGFLAAPVNLTATNGNRLLMGLAERADLILDFTEVPVGDYVLGNLGPDEPFGGGVPGTDFDAADPDSTGQIMQFRVVPAASPDPTTPPMYLQLPAIPNLSGGAARSLALLEVAETIPEAGFEGPSAAMLGVVDNDGMPMDRMWSDPISENPSTGATEVWEFFNFTADAHPMHVHEVVFEVVNRQALQTDEEGMAMMPAQLAGDPRPPEPWENGLKDTVIAYPGEVTRIRAKFGTPGYFVWHCHIVSHEDNEMMRPYLIGPADPNAPA